VQAMMEMPSGYEFFLKKAGLSNAGSLQALVRKKVVPELQARLMYDWLRSHDLSNFGGPD
jgi:hypothetical protein